MPVTDALQTFYFVNVIRCFAMMSHFFFFCHKHIWCLVKLRNKNQSVIKFLYFRDLNGLKVKTKSKDSLKKFVD